MNNVDPHDKDSVFKPVTVEILSDVFDFAIPTVVGKRYQFEGQSDLSNAVWIPIDQPFSGELDSTTGFGTIEHLLTPLPIAGTDKFFWRVRALSPLDADGD